MKSNVLLLLLVLLVNTITAQIQLGPKAGSNYSWVDQPETALLGYHIGIVAQLPLSQKFSFSPEIIFNTKGADYTDITFGTSKLEFRASYISLPTLIAWRPIKNMAVKAGPEFNFLVEDHIVDGEIKSSTIDAFRQLDLSMAAGIAVNVTKELGIEVRYSHGLTESLNILFTDANGVPLVESGTRLHRTLQAGVYYLFSL